jgi:hypothetical protein
MGLVGLVSVDYPGRRVTRRQAPAPQAGHAELLDDRTQ